MTALRLGLALPQYGKLADPTAVAGFAAAAEELGYTSLWVGDRVLTPLEPSDLYPGGGTPERPYPPEFVRFVDPFVALTAAASATRSARLGTSTLSAPLYTPVLLARTLTSLDLLSGGRVDAGFGLGWLRDEYTAIGVPWAGRGARLGELIEVLRTLWTADPAGHDGERWRIPDAHVGLRPVQNPHPPVLLGGMSERALRRVGAVADGWLPTLLPREYLRRMWSVITAAAAEAGRDPASLRRVLRINPREGTPVGTVTDLATSLKAVADEGFTEAFVDLHYVANDVAHAVELAGELRAAVGALVA
ncbi:TIGR03619 family F420-dependent LLM class oxidoreductase [Amycolatopsis sp. FDAARGOS 1241]|uniref:TIGR03619 family F420-dependent LLM class oxidoreductase n=1 Tax=Amycolatopsis sp. FDAARGOS 1241 TaxID=2778070 RepID=UPI00194DE761|nr:TIGR03619 family F420-dependent LLM class oxidoreductase [Amycolatopsis sp. FDAARGOS 1241]QRP45423.1 TIGR03619 family F420-dependent LLM class oxidoreductase [Amycolatopsis sp. FDAARGOS 1241]